MKEQLSDPGLLQTQAFINGQWVDAVDGAMLDITNPATGEVIASVAKVGATETAVSVAPTFATLAITSPVAGLVMSSIAPSTASTHCPLMNACVCKSPGSESCSFTLIPLPRDRATFLAALF